MKIAVIVMMAKLYSDAGAARANHPLTLAGAAMIVALPTLLIVRQPDLGTAVLVAATGAGVAFVGGISWRIVLGSAVTAMIAIPLSVRFLLKDYQRERIATFLNPDSDPLGSGYQILQSKIALGSGGMEGKGFLQGTQGQLAYLPEMSTDFAFAMFAEEFGFLGAMTILGLFALLIVRGVMIALSAKDRFAQLVGLGCALNLSLYALVNIAMVSGMAPVVGVPLPFISYGGTAMLSAMICVGLLQAIHVSRRTEQVSRQGLL
jgi:rod shape determining protein RodA